MEKTFKITIESEPSLSSLKEKVRSKFRMKVHLAAMNGQWSRHDDWLNMAYAVLGSEEYARLYDQIERDAK